MPAPTDPGDLLALARSGQLRAAARLLSLVEREGADGQHAREVVGRSGGTAYVVGVTGPPGVGKSTFTDALVAHYRGEDQRVGVLAVDPSSPFTGGALLGDRVRMGRHATDPQVLIRSVASRGHLGGLSGTTPAAIATLAAVGFTRIIVETVGVGQSEVEIAGLADSVVVLLAPGLGDGIQASKAGVLEIADLLVVNKADRPEAARLRRELRTAAHLSARDGWEVPVLTTVASRDEGIAEVAAALEEHREWGRTSGDTRRRLRARAETEILALAAAELRARARRRPDLTDQVADGVLDPHAAVAALLAGDDVELRLRRGRR